MDTSDVVYEQHQDAQAAQSSQQTQVDENESLKCTHDGCENNEVFITKAALK
jgi:hypothetical protein